MTSDVFVPYSKLERATRLALSFDKPRYFPTPGERGYVDFIVERWAEGSGFIVVEHDAVPWPGAVRKLRECPEPWCAYGHTEAVDFSPGTGYETSLHCAKFGADLIARAPDLPAALGLDVNWRNLATRITEYLHARSIFAHQHYPPILNLGRAE